MVEPDSAPITDIVIFTFCFSHCEYSLRQLKGSSRLAEIKEEFQSTLYGQKEIPIYYFIHSWQELFNITLLVLALVIHVVFNHRNLFYLFWYQGYLQPNVLREFVSKHDEERFAFKINWFCRADPEIGTRCFISIKFSYKSLANPLKTYK